MRPFSRPAAVLLLLVLHLIPDSDDPRPAGPVSTAAVTAWSGAARKP
jgi:hypothetical protein